MNTRILLINFTPQEHEKIAAFPVEVHSGYLSDRTSIQANADGSNRFETGQFWAPLPSYEYKSIFVRLTDSPPQRKDETQTFLLDKDTAGQFRRFWEKFGVLTIFLEGSEYSSLAMLGLPMVRLSAAQRDVTVSFSPNKIEDRPLLQLLRSIKSSISLPPQKYISVSGANRGEFPKPWQLVPIYQNRNQEFLGFFRSDHWAKDAPSQLILPHFKDTAAITVELIKTFSRIFPGLHPEIREVGWTEDDRYYPQEIQTYDQEILKAKSKFEILLRELQEGKEKAKEKYSKLLTLLTGSGEDLKNAVLWVLEHIWKLSPKDLDPEKTGKLKEDILIPTDGSEVFAEIKGTRNKNPTAAYFTQVLTHSFLRDRENTIPALILNYDSQTKPENRSNAYTDTEEQNVFDKVIFVDTRVLYYLSIAILDHGMPIDAGKKKLFGIGRVEFDLTEYVKTKVESNPVEGSQDIAKSKQN